MRTLLVSLIVLSGVLALNTTADAAGKRSTKPRHNSAQLRASPNYHVECERARHEDPTASFAGYTCWAREAFARGSQGNRQ
ncbi:MAG: hypothetical protein J2P50_20230 [Hyphomicrobiaceae bacterium]|nr:hypothetical protein [Hyphomicrobiaceae bacterium]